MLRVIGDVHGNSDEYLALAKEVEYSLQLGDMGFDYSHMKELGIDNHRFFAGNHDNFNTIVNCKNYLGDYYGMCKLGGVEFFYVGGAFSIDMPWRLFRQNRGEPKQWWEKEQMDFGQMLRCYHLYKKIKPDLVISHTCPTSISNKLFDSKLLESLGYDKGNFFCHTASLLDEMLKIHRPSNWYFGHFHQSAEYRLHGTKFQCLAELECIDLE